MSLDDVRAELIRSRGFLRGAETQLSKTLAALDAEIASRTTLPAPPPAPTPTPSPAGAAPIVDVSFDALADTAALQAVLQGAPFDRTMQRGADRMTLVVVPPTQRGHVKAMALRFNHPLGTEELTVGNEILVPGSQQEVWIEVECAWSPNFGTRGDHKTFMLSNQSDSYRSCTHVGMDSAPYRLGWDWPLGLGFPPQTNRYQRDVAPWLFDGRAHVLRWHQRHSTNPSAADGEYHLNIDGVAVLDVLGIRTQSKTGGPERFRSFIATATKNGGPGEDHYFYLSGARIWIQNPAWA